MRQRTCLTFWTILAVAFSGCQTLHNDARLEPFAHETVRHPLIVHSDFPLPEQDRVINQLIEQRGRISEKLDLATTDEPIHVYLFADAEAYYEFIKLQFPDFPARRAIFVETDAALAVYAHWGDHVAEDLRHEVAHGYLHAAVPSLPLWIDEGLAEYFEVSPGHRGINPPHVELLVAQTEVNAWQPHLSRLEQLSSAAEMTQQDYAEAWAWVHFLLESGGDKAELLKDYLADLRQGTASESLHARIRKRLAGPELALAEHLQSLR